STHEAVKPSGRKPWYCPMCEGVEADQPGDCPNCGMALERAPGAPERSTQWSCPMHPETDREGPGECPSCGMALEPRTVEASPRENPELAVMRQRLWVALVFAMPLFVFSMLPMIVPGDPFGFIPVEWRKWIELALATPVVLWCGW